MKTKKLNSRQMPPGAGKAEIALTKVNDLLADGARVTGMLVLRGQDLAGSMRSEISRQLGPQSPPDNLREMAGATIITLAEFDDHEEEIYEIPEVRDFFQKQNKIWAPWLFAGTIFTPDLFAIVLAGLPNVTCSRRDGHLHVEWVEEEMRAFLHRSLPAAAGLFRQAGIPKENACALLGAAAAYLGLPFTR